MKNVIYFSLIVLWQAYAGLKFDYLKSTKRHSSWRFACISLLPPCRLSQSALIPISGLPRRNRDHPKSNLYNDTDRLGASLFPRSQTICGKICLYCYFLVNLTKLPDSICTLTSQLLQFFSSISSRYCLQSADACPP